MPKLFSCLAFALVIALAPPSADSLLAAQRKPAAKRQVETAPFILDAGRILIEVSFRKPDGGQRKALAWFNMGMASPTLSKPLYRELQIGDGHPLRIELAGAALEAPPSAVTDGEGGLAAPSFEHLFAPHPVEAMLPASLLLGHVVMIDYVRRSLALTKGGADKPDGVAIPFDLNEKTGFATVDVAVSGESFPFVIDAGSGYSWMRGDVLKKWLAAHSDWRRAEGAIGLANNNMLDYAFEKQGTVARLPGIDIGAIELKDVGVLGTGPVFGSVVDGVVGDFFWDNWQKSAVRPVVGWLGANVLGHFKLTIDFPNRTSYWQAQSKPDPHDLDQVGVTLVRRDTRYFVGGLVGAVGGNAIEGASVGDEIVGIDALDARGASKTAVLAALGGKPGEIRRLRLLREGRLREVEARVLDLH
ncbi:peptide-binding protein [Methylocystis sp. 9N]|uniref:Peptide-binding protein n=1 Tax=Methylocystis borbori TaxID=3118750 RepID=A0ABU7XK33_9HYPH